MQDKKHTSAFTLIEMLVVLAIIAILASVVIVSLGDTRKKARDGERIAEIGQIQLALELYYNACKQYPSTLDVAANNGCPAGITFGTFIGASVPQDPLGSSYTYSTSGSGSSYDEYVVRAQFERNDPKLSEDEDGTIFSVNCDDSPNYYYCKRG